MSLSEISFIRPLVESDRNFIYSSWGRSFSAHYPLANKLSSVAKQYLWYRTMATVDYFFTQPGAFKILASKETPDQIFAWLCSELNVLHYMYTEKTWRQQGAQKILLAACGFNPETDTEASHWTWMIDKFFGKWKLKYNPYLLEEEDD